MHTILRTLTPFDAPELLNRVPQGSRFKFEDADFMAEDQALSNLYRLFGQAVLAGAGEQNIARLTNGKTPLTLALALDDDSLFAATTQSVVVFTGPVSVNLCVLVAKTRRQADRMLARNPLLAQTLVAGAGEQVYFYVRIKGWRPADLFFQSGCWISSQRQFLVHGRTDEDVQTGCYHPVAVADLRFEQIDWSFDPPAGFAFRLLQISNRFGEPLQHRPGPEGPELVLNPHFWAGWCKMEWNLHYDASQQRFHRPIGDADGTVTAPALMTALAEVMQQASRLKGMEALGTFREPAHLECILDTLRMHADEGPASTPENQLRQFLFRRVQPEEGSSVTMKELGEAYGRHCVANDIPLPPQRSLSNLITATIRQTFDLVQSHNVLREGRQVRGYRNLKLTLE